MSEDNLLASFRKISQEIKEYNGRGSSEEKKQGQTEAYKEMVKYRIEKKAEEGTHQLSEQ